MKVIVTGSTGMVGKGVLMECIDSDAVTSIVLVNRTPLGVCHKKIHEVICKDWSDLSKIKPHLRQAQACYFCMGATATTLRKAEFHHVTYDLTLAFAKLFAHCNPNAVFCYVSGMGVGKNPSSNLMWLRIKGKTEQALLQLPCKAVYLFRPGYIQPMRGVHSKTALYRLFYTVFGPFYPLFKRLFPSYVTSTVQIGRAMISVTHSGYDCRFLENSDINKAASEIGH
ncbi:MAG: epimerase [Myxococcota bacterium]